MQLTYKPYTLNLKHVFTVAVHSRTTTPAILTTIEHDGFTGYGEASMPPYLGESQETVSAFLKRVDLSRFDDPLQLEQILKYVDELAPGNGAAKASVDIALHDLVGKMIGLPWYKIWGFNPKNTPDTTFTIGIDTPDIIRQKIGEAKPYKLLKIKLGSDNDRDIIQTVRSMTDKPLAVDANQGWTSKEQALEMIHYLNERNCLLIEQPMPKEMIDETAWLTERSPLPIIADEALQRLCDVPRLNGVYTGINIKLMKCTGLREAHKMLILARSLGMKVMLGCMTETSCAVSAAAHLSPLVDWADLDGNLLITNDPFEGMKIIDGKITLSDRAGIGIRKI